MTPDFFSLLSPWVKILLFQWNSVKIGILSSSHIIVREKVDPALKQWGPSLLFLILPADMRIKLVSQLVFPFFLIELFSHGAFPKSLIQSWAQTCIWFPVERFKIKLVQKKIAFIAGGQLLNKRPPIVFTLLLFYVWFWQTNITFKMFFFLQISHDWIRARLFLCFISG